MLLFAEHLHMTRVRSYNRLRLKGERNRDSALKRLQAYAGIDLKNTCFQQLRPRLPMSMPSTKAMEAVTAMKSSHTANLPASSKDEGKVDVATNAQPALLLSVPGPVSTKWYWPNMMARHDSITWPKTIVFNLAPKTTCFQPFSPAHRALWRV